MTSAHESKSTAELTTQLRGLENFAATAISHGVEMTGELEKQILELREELSRRTDYVQSAS